MSNKRAEPTEKQLKEVLPLHSVLLKAPADVDRKGGAAISGKIIDEVWADPAVNDAQSHPGACNGGQNRWGDYSFCGQLIRWDNGSHTIRLCACLVRRDRPCEPGKRTAEWCDCRY